MGLDAQDRERLAPSIVLIVFPLQTREPERLRLSDANPGEVLICRRRISGPWVGNNPEFREKSFVESRQGTAFPLFRSLGARIRIQHSPALQSPCAFAPGRYNMTDSQHHENIEARLEADVDLAAPEVDKQYRARLCRLVERELNRRFRRREDPEDVVQSAFRTFFRRNAQDEFHIESSVDLWRLLETIARHKILKHVEKLGAGKRNPKREEYPEGDALQGQGPTPEEAAIAADLMEKSLAGLDETYMKILHMRLQKCTEEEIAAALGCTRGRVRTKLYLIRERLQRLSGDNAGE